MSRNDGIRPRYLAMLRSPRRIVPAVRGHITGKPTNRLRDPAENGGHTAGKATKRPREPAENRRHIAGKRSRRRGISWGHIAGEPRCQSCEPAESRYVSPRGSEGLISFEPPREDRTVSSAAPTPEQR